MDAGVGAVLVRAPRPAVLGKQDQHLYRLRTTIQESRRLLTAGGLNPCAINDDGLVAINLNPSTDGEFVSWNVDGAIAVSAPEILTLTNVEQGQPRSRSEQPSEFLLANLLRKLVVVRHDGKGHTTAAHARG